MAEDTSRQPVAADEALYVRARMLAVVFLSLLSYLGLNYPLGSDPWLLVALVLLLLIGSAVVLATSLGRRPITRVMMWVLVPELIVVGGFTYLLEPMRDGFYPFVVLFAVAYALIVSRRDSLTAGVAATVAYAIGHLMRESPDGMGWMLLMLKAGAVPLLSVMVSTSVERRREQQRETRRAAGEREEMMGALQRRVSELQAVSEITEVIHSSLDFERVGPVVLRIVSKLISVDKCCLFVVDKEKSETLFSASIGIEVPKAGRSATMAFDLEAMEEHFACISVFDHSNTIVLFCAGAEEISRLDDDDRLILGAVASELVVAVENSRLYKLTKKLSVTDELSGLANYRSLQTRLQEEIERARRYDKQFSFLMIDVDDFKGFNDEFGHVAGDAAIAEIARVLRSTVREVDLVARYGGEEFSIILPETDAAGGFVVAEKVREAVAQQRLSDEHGELRRAVTVSVGVATFPVHATDRESVLREADDALYRAKGGGKDRVRSAKPRVRTDEDVEEKETR